MSKKGTLRGRLGIFGSIPILLLQDKRIKPTSIKIYAAIQSFQGTDDSANPGLDKIQNRAGVSKNALHSGIQNLVENGWLEKIRNGLRKTNTYRCLTYFEPCDDFNNVDDKRVNNRFANHDSERKPLQKEILKENIQITQKINKQAIEITPNEDQDEILLLLLRYGVKVKQNPKCYTTALTRGLDYVNEKISLLQKVMRKKTLENPGGWLANAIIDNYTRKSQNLPFEISNTKECLLCKNKYHKNLLSCPVCSLSWDKRKDPKEIAEAEKFLHAKKGVKSNA